MSAISRTTRYFPSLFRAAPRTALSSTSARGFANSKDNSNPQTSVAQNPAQSTQSEVRPWVGGNKGALRSYDPFGDFFMDFPRTSSDWPFFADRFVDRQFKNMLAPFRSIMKDMREFSPEMQAWQPKVDITETDNTYLVHAELPGVAKENMKVEFENGILTIRGERRSEAEENKGRVYRIERSFGQFERSFQLPKNVQPKDIQANYKDGVLEIKVPKKAESLAHTIEVKEGDQKS